MPPPNSEFQKQMCFLNPKTIQIPWTRPTPRFVALFAFDLHVFINIGVLYFSFLFTSSSSSIELLLVRLHVDAAFQLSAGSTDLKSDRAVGDALVELGEAGHATVLQRVFQPGCEVGDELGDRSVINMSSQYKSGWRTTRCFESLTLCVLQHQTHPEQPRHCRPRRSSEQCRRCSSGCPWRRHRPSCPAWRRCCPFHGKP